MFEERKATEGIPEGNLNNRERFTVGGADDRKYGLWKTKSGEKVYRKKKKKGRRPKRGKENETAQLAQKGHKKRLISTKNKKIRKIVKELNQKTQ